MPLRRRTLPDAALGSAAFSGVAFGTLSTVLDVLPRSASAPPDLLPSWRESAAKRAIVRFVSDVSNAGGPRFVAPEARVASFDNDGTLWCERPTVEAVYMAQKAKALASRQPGLRERPAYAALLSGRPEEPTRLRPLQVLQLLVEESADDVQFAIGNERSGGDIAMIDIPELIRERRPRSWVRRAPLGAWCPVRRARVCAWLGAALLALSGPAGSKIIEAPTSELSGPLRSTVLRAQAVVGADTARLLALFRGLQPAAQSPNVERRLAEFIGRELLALGFQVELSAEAGEVVGVLRNGRGPTLVYRADTGIDLSLRVWLDPAPASRDAAAETLRCGPDAHVTWMLGMARALVALRSEWAGTLVLVGQATHLGPAPRRAAPAHTPSLRVPIPDFLVALRAAAEPVGSVLSVQGVRRPGSDQVEVTYERVGTYARSGSPPQLGTASARAYDLPENVQFGYLLVGIAEPSLDEHDGVSEAEPDRAAPDAAPPDGLEALRLELSAIPLGTKLATVAVLELLAKRAPAPLPAAPPSAGPLDLNLHRY